MFWRNFSKDRKLNCKDHSLHFFFAFNFSAKSALIPTKKYCQNVYSCILFQLVKSPCNMPLFACAICFKASLSWLVKSAVSAFLPLIIIWSLKYEPKSRLVTQASQAHVTRVECNLHSALSAATCYFSVGKVITLGHLVTKQSTRRQLTRHQVRTL